MNSDYLNAEYGVIGAMLIEPTYSLPIVTDVLLPDDFAIELNATIYKAVLAMREAGESIDPVTVIRRLGDTSETRQYIAECVDVTSTAANVASYASCVKNAAMLRAIKDTAYELQEKATAALDYTEPLGYAMDTFTAMQERGARGELVDSTEAMKDFYDYRDSYEKNPDAMFVRTGYTNLDNLFGGGMVNGGLYILAARPGCGKTTLALNIADNVATEKKPVLFISLEMSVRQITAKRIARNAGIPYTPLLMGHISDEDWQKLAKHSGCIASMPVTVNRKPGANLMQIESMARKVKGLRLLVIDYMGLIQPTEKRKSRYEAMTDTSGALKGLANRLNIPVLCLCQLNRESEAEKGKRPRLYHLRDSGAIEQDADAVMLLHVDPDIECPQPWDSVECTCHLDKNRHGATGLTKFSFYKQVSKMVQIRGGKTWK